MRSSDPTSASFDDIVRDHHAAVYRSAFRILGEEAAALDVTQRVYLRVLQREGDRMDAEQPELALCWAARRIALSTLRDRRRRQDHERNLHMDRSSDVSHRHAPTERDEQRAVRAAVDGLPDELRLPLMLRFEEGLTFADVGLALECSESTAHERVGRGLERLRNALRKLGFAGVAARLPDAIAAMPAPTVPTSTASTLLALAPPKVLLSGAAKLLFGLATAAVLVVTAAVVLREDGDGVEPDAVRVASAGMERPPRAADEPATERPSRAAVLLTESNPAESNPAESNRAGPSPLSAPVDGTATLTGRVFDPRGLDGSRVLVVVDSTERAAKLPEVRVRTHCDDRGEFEIALPIDRVEGREFVVTFASSIHRRSWRRTPALRAGQRHDLGVVQLERRPAVAEDEFLVEVRVTDHAGVAVSGVDVALLPSAGHSLPIGFRQGRLRAKSKSDADGRAEMRGRTLGGRRLFVDGRAVGRGLAVRDVDLDRAGLHEFDVALGAGRRVHGQVRSEDGRPLPPRLAVTAYAEDLPADILAVVVGSDGRFELRGLREAVPYQLHLPDGEFAASTTELAPGTASADIVLRPRLRNTDGKPRGILAGALLDAQSGAAVLGDAFSVEARWIGGVDEAAEVDPVAARLRALKPLIAQRMADAAPPTPNFHLALVPGVYVLLAEVSGYADQALGPFVVTADTDRRDLQIRLEHGVTCRGQVVDPQGQPVRDAWVTLLGAGPDNDVRAQLTTIDAKITATDGSSPYWVGRSTRTDAEGRFTMAKVPTGLPWRFVASDSAWRAVAADAMRFESGMTEAPTTTLRFKRPR